MSKYSLQLSVFRIPTSASAESIKIVKKNGEEIIFMWRQHKTHKVVSNERKFLANNTIESSVRFQNECTELNWWWFLFNILLQSCHRTNKRMQNTRADRRIGQCRDVWIRLFPILIDDCAVCVCCRWHSREQTQTHQPDKLRLQRVLYAGHLI